jgi:hypothetical protein
MSIAGLRSALDTEILRRKQAEEMADEARKAKLEAEAQLAVMRKQMAGRASSMTGTTVTTEHAAEPPKEELAPDESYGDA